MIIRVIVDQSGNESNVEAIVGPENLRAKAIRVIKRNSKWNLATQNGRMVKSYGRMIKYYKKQPVIFILAED